MRFTGLSRNLGLPTITFCGDREIEGYISKRSEADFSHSICPDCAAKLYPDMDIYE